MRQAPGVTVSERTATRGDTRRHAPARLGFVDSLRALAALYVVAHHISEVVWPRQNPPAPYGAFLVIPMIYGQLAVAAFIVLSGFSLMLPVARHGNRLPWSVAGFYWRRARRILPPYYLAMALSLLLIWLWIGQKTGTDWDVSLPVTMSAVVEHVLLLQDFSMTQSQAINYAFWSIAMECQIYLLFPLLVPLWRRYPPLLASVCVTLASLIALYALYPTWIGQLPFYSSIEFAPQFFGLFAMGMFGASVYRSTSPVWRHMREWRVWDALALGSLALLFWLAPVIHWYVRDLIVGVATVGLLLAAARAGVRNPIHAALEWRPLVWIGGFSYSVYLIHAPLIQLLWQYGLRPLGFGLNALPTYLALLAVGLPLIVAASWLFWWACERPFLNSKPLGWRGATQASAFADVRVRDKTR